MKIIVIGVGKLGFSLASSLNREGHDITVIDLNPAALKNAANRLDVGCINGNGVDNDVLMEAGVNSANLVIATTGRDELNILTCLVAKKLGARHTIARVRDPKLSRNLNLLREDLHLSMWLNPEQEAASEIARILRFPSARKIDFLARGKVELVQLKLTEDSPLNGVVLRELRNEGSKVLVCAVQRGSQVMIPDGDFVLRAGDTVSITASPRDITTFFRLAGLLKKKIRSVAVVGGGRTTWYLAGLLADSDIALKIIERDHERCRELTETFPRAMIIEGDGSDKELLQEENISSSDALAAMTGLDEENVVISMYAVSQRIPKVLAKVNHIGFSEVLESTGIDSVITPHYLATQMVVRYVRARQNSLGSHVESLTRLYDDRVEALEFRVKDTFKRCNVPLKDLALRKGLLIASIIRAGKVIYPHGDDSIHADDSVIIITTLPGLDDLNDILDKQART